MFPILIVYVKKKIKYCCKLLVVNSVGILELKDADSRAFID